MIKLKIMDFYVHQGHQREFFRTGHDFYLSGCNSLIPDWNKSHRPLGDNVNLIDERDALSQHNFDIIIVRSPLNIKRYEAFYKNGAKAIAVVQTTDSFKIPDWVSSVVWNSETVMNKFKSMHPKKKHFYIPHGYDPTEFIDNKQNRELSALSLFNVFKKRSSYLGYDMWKGISDKVPCKIYGHGNKDMELDIREASSFKELIDIYNSYALYLNTTTHSAMPRSRCEAMFCGMPMVSTNNYDIDKYLKHGENAILTNDKDKMIGGIKKLLESEAMREDFGKKSREVAIKYFHLNDYLKSWNEVFDQAL
jgi:glycosyltransferase involved in cell wall biosynthesis